MATVSVVIPWGPCDDSRRRPFTLVTAFYAEQFPDWQVLTPHAPSGWTDNGECNCGHARHLGAILATGDVLVFNDGDSICSPPQLREAVHLAATAPGLVFAYTRYRRLHRHETEPLTSWREIGEGERPGWASDSNGCVAISRASYNDAGGYDPQYVGYGYEDLAFNRECETRWTHRRVEGELWHLWHRPAGGRDDTGGLVHTAAHEANRIRYINGL